MSKKMWATYVTMTKNFYGDYKDPFPLEQEAWDEILVHLSKKGYNTIVLDICDSMIWKSHPEISVEGAWSHEKMKAEVKKANDLGLTVIPKINFSAHHDCWLGEYSRMLCTPIYYGVCRDLIKEICEVFDTPEYVHIGRDEESYVMAQSSEFVCYRQHALLWHDLRFFIDCVKENGSKAWIWADFLMNHPEEFRKHIKPDEVLLSPWQYYAMYEENFRPITYSEKDYNWYTSGVYKNSGFKFIEEEPICANYRKEVIPALKDGYSLVPTTSYFFKCDHNHEDTIRWFSEVESMDNLVGFMDAPWKQTTMACLPEFKESVDLLMEARKKLNFDL